MRKPTASLDAYDTYLRGLARIRNRSSEANDEALALWRKAIELDPEFALAYAMAAFCYCRRKGEGWTTQQDVAETRRLARRAVEFGKDDAGALCFAGYAARICRGELDDGAAFVDQALILNPNLAHAWHWGGWTKLYLGEPDAAIGRRRAPCASVRSIRYLHDAIGNGPCSFLCRSLSRSLVMGANGVAGAAGLPIGIAHCRLVLCPR